jgi:hypothetical protein
MPQIIQLAVEQTRWCRAWDGMRSSHCESHLRRSPRYPTLMCTVRLVTSVAPKRVYSLGFEAERLV